MRTLAIVPIKSFDLAKQRLAESLASGGRRSLVQAMFSDVLGALRRTERVERIAVVTADVAAGSIATGERMVVLHDGISAGQSAATEIGIRYALDQGFDRVLLVPGDTPLIEAGEISMMMLRAEEEGLAAVIVPDRHGTGTNALLLSPPDAMQPSFGPDSLERHRQAALDAGISHRVEAVASLMLDVDTPDDLTELSATLEERRGQACMTRGALRQLNRARVRPQVALASSLRVQV